MSINNNNNNNQRNNGRPIDITSLITHSLRDQNKVLTSDELNQIDNTLFDREIRTTLFPIFHSVLKNPPSSLLSLSPHSPGVVAVHANNSTVAKGFLYLFDKSAASYYANDGIRWAKTKTNVRMIIFNDDQQCYKLKTHKKDVGSHVMRRQTYGGVCENGIFWRKFEYKLIKREYLLKLEDDNTVQYEDNGDEKYSERLCVQDFPILVHYLTRPAAENKDAIPIEVDTDESIQNNTNSNINNMNNINNISKKTTLSSNINLSNTSSLTINDNNNNNTNNNNNNNNNSKKRESPFNLSSISSSTILNLFKKKKNTNTNNTNNNIITNNSTVQPIFNTDHINSNNNNNNILYNNNNNSPSITSSSSSSPEFTQPPTPLSYSNGVGNNPYQLGDSFASTTATTPSSNLADDNYFLDFTDGGWSAHDSTVTNNVFSTSTLLNTNTSQPLLSSLTSTSLFQDTNNNNSVGFLQLLNDTTTQPVTTSTTTNNSNSTSPTTNTTYTNDYTTSTTNTTNNNSILVNNILQSTQSQIPQIQQQPSISSYTPDTSPSLEQSKVICLVNGFDCFAKGSKQSSMYFSFWAVFEGGIEILALPIAPGVLEFNSPIWGDAAITHFYIVCKQNGSKNVIQQTTAVPFCFTPSDHRGKLKIALDRCKSFLQPFTIIPKFRHFVKHLDLSNNALTNIDFLNGFYRLESLILNNNQLTEHTVFPTLPELQNLDLSNNLINFPKVSLFTERLMQSSPYLTSLNLIDNEEYPCPHKAPHHHYNYRIYIISRFPQLTKLDLQAVSIEERKHAHNVEDEVQE